MNKIIIILLTFILAFATTLLLDWSFVAQNLVRYILVIILILIEIFVGYKIVQSESLNPKA